MQLGWLVQSQGWLPSCLSDRIIILEPMHENPSWIWKIITLLLQTYTKLKSKCMILEGLLALCNHILRHVTGISKQGWQLGGIVLGNGIA
jgi:hypothetical protein